MAPIIQRIRHFLSDEARRERKAARAEWSERWKQSQAEEQAILAGRSPLHFATTRSPLVQGQVQMGPAYARIRGRYSFNSRLTFATPAGESRTTPARVDHPATVCLPADTEVWMHEEILDQSGKKLGYVSSVDHVPTGQQIDSVPVSGPCGENLVARISTLEHIKINFTRDLTITSTVETHRPVVLVTANDRDRPLDLGAEQAAIERAIGWNCVRAVPAATPGRLVEAIDQHSPAVLHFAGHSNTESLYLRDELDHEIEVTSENFRDFVEGRGIRLLILNSCYSNATAEMCLPYVSTVIGSSSEVDDEDACRFAGEFYASLSRGLTAEQAMKNATDIVKMHDGEDYFVFLGEGELRLNIPSVATPRQDTSVDA
ncbi:CHAT domain-containing protein [Phytoactinopolyspora limicola]|uniref:CHAT domain-containing protein n=1 Tax=Phytoactinopolyspora limicola TaxID=2715536 RepID=UPI00140DBC83|nr:CHAT domain-containing protein [Phytoactinopolyspora limicola]